MRAKKCAKMVLNLSVLPEDAIIPSSPKNVIEKERSVCYDKGGFDTHHVMYGIETAKIHIIVV